VGGTSAGRLPLPQIVAFDSDPLLVEEISLQGDGTVVCFGDGANPEVLHAYGIEAPRAIFITYDDHRDCLGATLRLRAAFDAVPIYCRSQTRAEALALRRAGATEAVVETDELPRSAPLLLEGGGAPSVMASFASLRHLRPAELAAAVESTGVTEVEAARLLELYGAMDADGDGNVDVGELKTALAKSSTAGVLSDAAVGELERRVTAVVGDVTSVDFVQFCRISMADLEEAAAACVDE